MKNIVWDYEDSKTKYYQIFGISDKGEELLGDESICLNINQTKDNDKMVSKIVKHLDCMAND